MPRGRPRGRATGALIRSAEVLGWALGGLEREIVATRARLAALTAQANILRRKAGVRIAQGLAAAKSFDEPAVRGRKARRHRLSAAGRKALSQKLRKRWAERKKKGLTRL